jgi:hypothetical protein
VAHTSTKKHNPGDRSSWHPRYCDRSVVGYGTLRRYAHSLDLSQREIAIRSGLRPDSSLVRKWLSLGHRDQHMPMPLKAFEKLVQATESPLVWTEIKAAIPVAGFVDGSARNLEHAVFSHPAIQKREAEHFARSREELLARLMSA